MTHWLLVSSADNFETSRTRGFDIAGMKTRWKKAAGEVAPGDTVFFYLTGIKAIGGEAKVAGEAYFDDTVKIWDSTKPGEVYPWRFPITIVNARAKDEYLPVEDFLQDYEKARKWAPEHWTLAFQGNVHRLTGNDYKLIHGLI